MFRINVLSLFDGISCGQVALKRSGIKCDTYFASEINPDSIQVTQHNHPDTVQLGSVLSLTDDKLKTLPQIDLILAGSPCQDLSKAKTNGKGLHGEKSKLFYEFHRILKWIQQNNNPNVKFLLENVKMNQESRSIISDLLGVKPIEINSVLVSPQRRIRLYWTNIEDVTQPKDKGLKIKDVVYDNTYKVFSDPRIEKTKTKTKNYIKYDLSGKGYYSQQDRAYYLDGTMCTVPKAQPTNKLNIWLGDDKYRRSHPIEAERYQTLPDNYTDCIESHNKRIGLVGDGWTVDVIAHIFQNLK